MKIMSLRNALETAVVTARAAGDILRRDFHRPGGPRGGGDKAEADLEAEHEIRARLLASFASWGYLGEETGRVDGEPGAPVWVVDPNDGTRDYLAGRRGSAVSIGLIAERRPVLGVVFAFGYPDDEGDLFAWAEGEGPLTRNGRPLSTRLPDDLSAADVVLVSSKGDRDPDTNLQCATPARYRTVPSIAHRLALLAAGEAAAVTSLYGPCTWDYGAGHALVRAAGGVLVDEAGQEIAYDEQGWSQAREAYAGSAPVARMLATRPWSTGNVGPWVGDRPARLRPRRGGGGRRVAGPGPGLPGRPDRGRQPGQPGGVRAGHGDRGRPSRRPAAAGGRRRVAHAGGAAHRRLRDGAGAGPLDRGAGALRRHRRRARLP